MRIVLIASLLLLFVLFCNAQRSVRGSTIVITSNTGSNEWWLAYSVSDPSTTNVELMDSGSYSSWQPLQSTNWGYWTFSASQHAVTFPVSLRLSAGSVQLTVANIFLSPAPGAYIDTKLTYSNGNNVPPESPTEAPTSPPKPNDPPTEAPQTPTEAPSQPTTPTQAPSTAPPTPPTAAPNPPAPPPTTPSGGNPFQGTKYYINPHYTIEVDSSIASNPSIASTLAIVKNYASAFWIDRMAVIDNVTTILTQARLQATQAGQPIMVALVVYDLPARDCAAAASNGEIACADVDCTEGISTYKTGYIDAIVNVLRNFLDITIVAVIEPDSLPNLATNLAVPKCTIAQQAYITGVSYAIQQLSQFSNVHMYVDAAHGGWLGWDTGRATAAGIFQQVLTLAGGASKIRGFATNVANYQHLGSTTDTADPCNLASQYNFAINEVKYVSLLDASLAALGITGMHYIIDTGRNGVLNSRTDCSNWCNIKNAGIGIPPTSDTSATGLTNIDAYFWVKPPGESDGTSDTSAPRFDFHCGSSDSRIPAPEAGAWFSDSFVALATNANPAL